MVRLNLCYKDVVCKLKDDKTFVIANIQMKKSRSRTRFRSRRESKVCYFQIPHVPCS